MLDVTIKPVFSVKRVKGHPAPGHILIGRKEDLTKLSLHTLVELHDAFTPGLPVRKFVDRTEAVDKTWTLIAPECGGASARRTGDCDMTDPTATTEDNMATNTEGKTKRTRKAAPVTATKRTRTAKKAANDDAPRGRQPGQETPVVHEALRMLRRQNGATKAELNERLGEMFKTQPGYVNGLISRVLKEKGYDITAEAQEGSREKRYFVPADKGPDIDFKKKNG